MLIVKCKTCLTNDFNTAGRNLLPSSSWLLLKNKCTLCCKSILSSAFLWCKRPMFWRAGMREGSHSHYTLGGISSICFRFYFQQTLRVQIQGCQGCQKTRNFMRNSKILIARSTIQPKLSKIKNNLPFFKQFWWIS